MAGRIKLQLVVGTYEEINRINPSGLSAPHCIMVKEVFKQARLLQLHLSQKFMQ